MDRELFWSQGGDCQIRVQGIKDAYVIAHRFERAGKWQSGLPSGIEAETIIGWAERLERKEREEGSSGTPFSRVSEAFSEEGTEGLARSGRDAK